MTSPAPDLLELTAELVAIPSESRAEAPLVAHLERVLGEVDGLELTRVGDNLVARTRLGRPARLVLAGHTDTVPAHPGDRAHLDGDRCYGTGAADMKAGLAIMVDLARRHPAPAVDVTYVFYAREEIAAADSGLLELIEQRPDLLAGDVAVLGEPTDGWIEAGCQGTLRLVVHLRGTRAHTARPWLGDNAVHRLGSLLVALAGYEERRPVLDGCTYREALQAVRVAGGVAGNVVPDHAEVAVNHRFAPDRTGDEALAHVRSLLEPHLAPGDTVEVEDLSPGAPPGLEHPLLHALISRNQLPVRAKLGWTDVARFAALGIPAVNLGPGDPERAHTAGEFVERAALERTASALEDLLVHGAG